MLVMLLVSFFCCCCHNGLIFFPFFSFIWLTLIFVWFSFFACHHIFSFFFSWMWHYLIQTFDECLKFNPNHDPHHHHHHHLCCHRWINSHMTVVCVCVFVHYNNPSWKKILNVHKNSLLNKKVKLVMKLVVVPIHLKWLFKVCDYN